LPTTRIAFGSAASALPAAALLDGPVEVVAVPRVLGNEGEDNDVGVGGHIITLALE